MLGVGDLRASLGLPPHNPDGQGEHPLFYKTVAKLVAASKRYGIPLMVPAFKTNQDTVDWLRDFKLIVTSVDVLNLVKAHRQDLALMKQSLSEGQNGSGHHKGQ